MYAPERVIYIQGVGDEPQIQQALSELWQPHGLAVEYQPIEWAKSDYEQRLEDIGLRLEELAELGRVSLVGASGGGKAALSLLASYPHAVHRAVTINSKVGPYILSDEARAAYPNLVISSDMLPLHLRKIYRTSGLVARILCMVTQGDKTVEPEEAMVHGARSFMIRPGDSSTEKAHIAGIAQALTTHGLTIANHLRGD